MNFTDYTQSYSKMICGIEKDIITNDDSGIATELSVIDLDSQTYDEDRSSTFVVDTTSLQPQNPEDLVDLLPWEIWLKIFKKFSPYELCNVGLACKSFLSLTRDPLLWTELRLVGDALAETSTVINLLKRSTLLSRIR